MFGLAKAYLLAVLVCMLKRANTDGTTGAPDATTMMTSQANVSVPCNSNATCPNCCLESDDVLNGDEVSIKCCPGFISRTSTSFVKGICEMNLVRIGPNELHCITGLTTGYIVGITIFLFGVVVAASFGAIHAKYYKKLKVTVTVTAIYGMGAGFWILGLLLCFATGNDVYPLTPAQQGGIVFGFVGILCGFAGLIYFFAHRTEKPIAVPT